MPNSLNRRELLAAAGVSLAGSFCGHRRERLAVLTFDDAVKSHCSFVAPFLKDFGFQATFLVTHRWMDDTENFMSWQDIAELHQMGFEIGNHSWTHANFGNPRNAARLAGELALVENELRKVEVPKPISYAHCGNGFGPESVAVLRNSGIRFARRGMQPEFEYGTIQVGPTFDPAWHHPLLIPTTADAYPDWTLEHFDTVLAAADAGGIVVLQFHGVPDVAHPWVHTPPEMFERYMQRLKQEGFRTLAMRDLAEVIGESEPPADPMRGVRYPVPKPEEAVLPVEVEQTQGDLDGWFAVMRAHAFTSAEMALVSGLSEVEAARRGKEAADPARGAVSVMPYPGGRHPRIGFLEGAIDPLRGTKASVFLHWSPGEYVVVDLPEAIFSGGKLLYLAHTHIPTVWNEQNVVIDNVDWTRGGNGGLVSRWELPNRISFGARIDSETDGVRMELWLTNGTATPLTGLRTQICVMLKGAGGFNKQTTDNKIFEAPVAAVRSGDGKRWILTAWERTGRSWGNKGCPCFHADPVLPDCAPGQTERVRGRLWFYEGESAGEELKRAAAEFA